MSIKCQKNIIKKSKIYNNINHIKLLKLKFIMKFE